MDTKSKITTLAILAAATCSAREAQRKVTVCVSDVSLARKVDEVIEARETASDMFAAIGVKLDWRLCPKSGGQGTIVISLQRVLRQTGSHTNWLIVRLTKVRTS